MATFVVTPAGQASGISPDRFFSGANAGSILASGPNQFIFVTQAGEHLVIDGDGLHYDASQEYPWNDGAVTAVRLFSSNGVELAAITEIGPGLDLWRVGELLDEGRPADVMGVLFLGDDSLVGGDGNDALVDGMGNDTVDAGNGDDTVYGGQGSDSLDGGAGTNTLSYEYVDSDPTTYVNGVNVNLGAGIAIDQWGGVDEVFNFQHVRGSNHIDTLIGDSRDNILSGMDGNDDILGLEGNDTLEGGLGDDNLDGGLGDDYIDGGEGHDTLKLSGLRDEYRIRRNGDGTYTVIDLRADGIDGTDTVRNVEDIYFGDGRFAIESLVSAPKSLTDQNVAEDTRWTFSLPAGLFAGSASGFTATSADGGPLPDWLQFDATTRSFAGTPPRNWFGSVSLKVSATEFGETASVSFKLNVQSVNDAPSNLILSGGAVAENSANGTLVGWITGWDDDSSNLNYSLVDGAGGRFAVRGNQLVVADGSKLDYEQARSHQVTLRATDEFGASITRTFTVSVGDVGNEDAKGSAGGDVIKGGSGADKIAGGLGNDVLTGGKGRDTFVFGTKLDKKNNVDTVTDFNVKDDTFHLDNAIFKKLGSGTPSKPKALNKDFFTIGTKAKDKNDHLIYDKSKGYLYYDADGSGKGAAVLFAKITKNLALTDKDFLII